MAPDLPAVGMSLRALLIAKTGGCHAADIKLQRRLPRLEVLLLCNNGATPAALDRISFLAKTFPVLIAIKETRSYDPICGTGIDLQFRGTTR